jgi:hypothetical protein
MQIVPSSLSLRSSEDPRDAPETENLKERSIHKYWNHRQTAWLGVVKIH